MLVGLDGCQVCDYVNVSELGCRKLYGQLKYSHHTLGYILVLLDALCAMTKMVLESDSLMQLRLVYMSCEVIPLLAI